MIKRIILDPDEGRSSAASGDDNGRDCVGNRWLVKAVVGEEGKTRKKKDGFKEIF